MKKTYINPEMEVIKLETQQIIAASIGLNNEQVNGGLSRDLDFDFDPNNLINQLLGL